MKAVFTYVAALFAGLVCMAQGAAAVFSGPQPGEQTTGFKVAGTSSGSERDPIAENEGRPVVLVFVHALERSLAPLLRAVDEYAASRSNHLGAEVVFLANDRISGEQRMKAAQGSLKLKSKVGLSLDGAEGPGNYGLNKDCMMTIVVAKGNKVTDNFALVQPGIADAPKVIAALAKVSGDENPPSAETLLARGGGEGMRRREMRRDGNDPFPGAVPTDAMLTGLLRQFIRPTNDEATVNKVLEEVKTHIKGNPDLQKQAIDGWTRVLHFGERYGTPHARKVGTEFLESLKKETEAK